MIVIVTGASKGIGKAVAAAFAAEGATLLLCARHEKQLMQTQAGLQGAYPAATIEVKAFDLSEAASVKAFGAWCLGFGTPAIVVNNAGVYYPGNILDEQEGSLEKMINTNLYSAYHLTRVLLPSMISAHQGHIFNICSVASLKAYPNGGGYSISKFALMGFDKNLRHELQPHGIKVTGVYPGAVLTDSWGDYDNSDKRIMETGDVANMILAASKLSIQAVVEEIIIRPQLGDL